MEEDFVIIEHFLECHLLLGLPSELVLTHQDAAQA